MATVTGLTAERMEEIEAASIVDGNVVGGDLILTRQDGTDINAGSVEGPAGSVGPTGPGVPNGGTTGQSLVKISNADQATGWSTISAPTVPIGLTLPASPANGDEAILVDSLTTPTYAWRFKYSTGISDANKWIFIGGAPIVVAGQAVMTSASWTTLCSITVPRAGIYALVANSKNRIGGGSLTNPNQRVVVAGSQVYSNGDGVTSLNFGIYAARTSSIAASSVIQVDYVGNATDAAYGAANLSVVPVRVA